jgi:hypothetical protein
MRRLAKHIREAQREERIRTEPRYKIERPWPQKDCYPEGTLKTRA